MLKQAVRMVEMVSMMLEIGWEGAGNKVEDAGIGMMLERAGMMLEWDGMGKNNTRMVWKDAGMVWKNAGKWAGRMLEIKCKDAGIRRI